MEFWSTKANITYILALLSVVALLLFYRIRLSRRNIFSSDPGTLVSPISNKMKSFNTTNLQVDDPELIQQLRKFYIRKPPNLPYNLTNPKLADPSPGQAAYVDKLLNHKTNGFFIECGANTGEHYSNTLYLERYRNWTGILIEPNPTAFKELKTKNRNAFSLNACLHAYPSMETLYYEDGRTVSGNIIGRHYLKKKGKGVRVQVPCFPLYSVLLALGRLKIDYFSLDVEGAEKWILNSIPWTKVDIEVMSIEYHFWSGGNKSLTKFMEKKGYKLRKTLTKGSGFDIIVQRQ